VSSPPLLSKFRLAPFSSLPAITTRSIQARSYSIFMSGYLEQSADLMS
jgi:hypothetical protein